MTPEPPDVELLKRYLLGLATSEEQAEMERRMQEPLYRDYLEAVEDELIDDYLEGRLTGDSCDRFEKHYLNTPERRLKLELARSLGRSLGAANVWWSRWLIAIAAFLLGALLPLVLLSRRSAQTVSYVPAASVYRGESKQQPLRISPEALLVQLELNYASRLVPDSAFLRSVDSDEELWRQRLHPPLSSPIHLTLPATLLPPGDYLLTLNAGSQVIATYSFRAEKNRRK